MYLTTQKSPVYLRGRFRAQNGYVAMSSWPHYDEEQISAVTAVLRSGKGNYWSGTECREFEREYASYLGRRHAIAIANGTVALELALEAFGIGEGDEVIVPSRTFVASASCAVMRGCVPVVVDVDRDSQCITAEEIERAITPRTKAVTVVHLAGWPCDMDSILKVAEAHGLYVIEDCAQAHGAFYKGRPVGSMGHAAAFSFCQDKIMTTGGEGGLLVLDDETAWKRAWAYKDIGRSYDAVFQPQNNSGIHFRWFIESFGTNWRMTEMQAAIGRIQLRRLPDWVEKRRSNAERLRNAMYDLPAVRCPWPASHIEHAFYKFYAFIEPQQLRAGWSRDRILGEIEKAGVPCGVGSCSEIYLEKAFVDRGWGPSARLPVARELGECSMMFQVHPTLTDNDLMHTTTVLREILSRAGDRSLAAA